MPTTSKQAKLTAKKQKQKDPDYYSNLGKKSAASKKHNTFSSLAARRASFKRWHKGEPLPPELEYPVENA